MKTTPRSAEEAAKVSHRALLHAGWRGTAAKILREGVTALVTEAGSSMSSLVIHCGVSICGACYEVGSEVAEALGPGLVDVRGVGLLIGIEFAEASFTRQFVAQMIARGVIVNWTLNADRVVRLAPPLTISEEEIDFAVASMKQASNAALELSGR